MSKSVLVIDTPQTCGECLICASYQESAFSVREYWCPAMKNKDVEPDEKPEWCPLKANPYADAKPVVHAKWLENTYCSNCNYFAEDENGYIILSFTDYCPGCGAKMDET